MRPKSSWMTTALYGAVLMMVRGDAAEEKALGVDALAVRQRLQPLRLRRVAAPLTRSSYGHGLLRLLHDAARLPDVGRNGRGYIDRGLPAVPGIAGVVLSGILPGIVEFVDPQLLQGEGDGPDAPGAVPCRGGNRGSGTGEPRRLYRGQVGRAHGEGVATRTPELQGYAVYQGALGQRSPPAACDQLPVDAQLEGSGAGAVQIDSFGRGGRDRRPQVQPAGVAAVPDGTAFHHLTRGV